MKKLGLTHAARAARRDMILREYRAGMKVEAIAARYGVSPRTVRHYATDAKVQRPRGRPSVWPECPPDQLRIYRKIAREVGAIAARAAMEGAR